VLVVNNWVEEEEEEEEEEMVVVWKKYDPPLPAPLLGLGFGL